MSLTPDGAAAFAEWASQNLAGAEVVVSDGDQEARAPLTQAPSVDGATVLLRAEFAEEQANFDWTERQIVLGDRVLDSVSGDFGRKSAGAIWAVEVPIELGPADG